MSAALAIHDLPPGSTKIVLAGRELARIAKIMDTDAGIFLSDEKSTLVHSRLVKRLRVLGLNSFVDYCDLVESEAGKTGAQGTIIGPNHKFNSLFSRATSFRAFD